MNISFNEKKIYRSPLHYRGNIAWAILLLLLFFPVGILWVALNTYMRMNGVDYTLSYRGGVFWLYFWSIVFFPVAILLGVLVGFDINGQSAEHVI